MNERPRVGEILVSAGIIDEMQLEAALGEQTRWGRRLGVTLIKLGMVEEGHLIRALAKQLDLPVASLAGKRIPESVIALVPARVASENGVIPLFTKKIGQTVQLYLGMEDPSNLAVLDDLSFRTGMEIHPVMVGPSELSRAIDRYYHGGRGGKPQVDPFQSGDTMGAGSLRIVTDDTPQPGTAPITSENAQSVSTKPPRIAASSTHSVFTADALAVAASSPDPIELSNPMAALPEGLLEDVASALAETERTRVVAKAMAQLLVKKGLLDLDELQDQIAEVKAKAAIRPAPSDAEM